MAAAGQLAQRPAPLPRQRKDLRPQIHAVARRQRAPEILALGRGHVELLHLRHLRPAFPQLLGRRGDLRDHLAAAAHELLQVPRRIGHQNAPVIHDDDPVAGHFRLGQDMGGNQHRMGAAQPLDELADHANLVRVQPDGRLVQDDQLRLMDQGIRQPHPLPEPLGELPDHPPAHFGQPALFHDHIHARARMFAAQAFQPGPELQVFPHPHVIVQRVVLRHIPDAAAHFVGLRKNIQPGHPHGAGSRRQVAGQDAHRGALARPVGAQQTHDFAPPDREGDVRNSRIARVALGQVGDFDHQVIAH